MIDSLMPVSGRANRTIPLPFSQEEYNRMVIYFVTLYTMRGNGLPV